MYEKDEKEICAYTRISVVVCAIVLCSLCFTQAYASGAKFQQPTPLPSVVFGASPDYEAPAVIQRIPYIIEPIQFNNIHDWHMIWRLNIDVESPTGAPGTFYFRNNPVFTRISGPYNAPKPYTTLAGFELITSSFSSGNKVYTAQYKYKFADLSGPVPTWVFYKGDPMVFNAN